MEEGGGGKCKHDPDIFLFSISLETGYESYRLVMNSIHNHCLVLLCLSVCLSDETKMRVGKKGGKKASRTNQQLSCDQLLNRAFHPVRPVVCLERGSRVDVLCGGNPHRVSHWKEGRDVHENVDEF